MTSPAGDWLKVHRAVFDHPKTKRLAKRVGIDVSAAAGYLICLWTWAMTVAPEGDLSRYDPEEVEAAAGWGGAEGLLYHNLVFCHWIDRDDDHDSSVIHDWSDWRGPMVDHRAKDAERKRIERASRARPQDAQGTSTVRPQDVPVKEEKRRDKSIGDFALDFEQWWVTYGRVGSKVMARECYIHWRTKGFSAERLLAAIAPYHADCAANDRTLQHASTFLKKKLNCWEEWITEEHGLAKPNGNNGNGKPTTTPREGYRWARCRDIVSGELQWEEVAL